MALYTGEEAKRIVHQILSHYDEDGQRYPLFVGSCGYYQNEDGSWSAWDNMTGDCWCEDFKTKKEAVAYTEEYYHSSL